MRKTNSFEHTTFYWIAGIGLSIIILLLPAASVSVQAAPAGNSRQIVQNEKMLLELNLSNGITVTRIYNRVSNVDHLPAPSSLFEYAVNNGTAYQSNNGTQVEQVSGGDANLIIIARAINEPLRFRLELSLAPDGAAVIMRFSATNLSSNKLFLRTVLPKIKGVRTANPDRMMGTIPQEIGSVSPLRPGIKFGMPFNIGVGLPAEAGANTMEVASLYDQDGRGGIFFADVSGDLDQDTAPIQLTLSTEEVAGFWISYLKPNQQVAAPELAIGVHASGDWHVAVDYYLARHQGNWNFPDTPAWLKEAGGIYTFGGGGAGGIYLHYNAVPLKGRINHFSELPKLLQEARALGSNVVYLHDYWDGPADREYFFKGEYLPRADLGGGAALAEAIQAIHNTQDQNYETGGKVILYLEPFITYPRTLIRRAQDKGKAWSSFDHLGGNLKDRFDRQVYGEYVDNGVKLHDSYQIMNAAFVPWQDEVVKIAQRLVGEYGADGVMLDSWGWQTNWAIQTRAEGIKYNPADFSQAALRLVDRVRAAVRAINPEAVVISETTSGPIGRHVDGGFSGDFEFDWLKNANQEKIIASPVRYAMPNVNYYSNGRTLGELHQVYAAGHNLALCSPCIPRGTNNNFMDINRSHIKNLLDTRRTYKDALIYGQQQYQPKPNRPEVVAYYYQGSQNQIITLVNTSQYSQNVTLTLDNDPSDSPWIDVLTQETFTSSGQSLPVRIGGGNSTQGLRVLQRVTLSDSPAPTIYPVTQFDPTIFSGFKGNWRNSWTPYDGNWSMLGASMVSSAPQSAATLTYDKQTGANFTFSATVMVISGAEAGVSFRLGSEFKLANKVEDVREDYTKGYDVILSQAEGRIKIARRPYQVISQYQMPVWTNHPYQLMVIANGARIQVFLDGNRVMDVLDKSPYASGRFGLTNYKSTAKFDDLVIQQWTPPTLPHLLYGDIRDKWEELGADQSPLGMPTTSETAAARGGRYNEFEAGFIYWKSPLQTYAVYGMIGEKWNALGREQGYGYPISDEQSAPDGIGFYNDFENGGAIYALPGTGAFEIHGDIRLKWLGLGGVKSPLGYPTSDEKAAGNGWRYNEFQYGFIYWKSRTQTFALYGAIGAKWNALGRGPGFSYPIGDEKPLPGGGWGQDFENGGSIYVLPGKSAFEVHGSIKAKWLSLGGVSSALGYPVSDERPAAGGGRVSHFQYGSIYFTPQGQLFVVLGKIGEKYNQLGREAGFGYPADEERRTPDGGYYQHFQNGGSIYYKSSVGAYEVHGAIREKWAGMGWERSFLGYPLTDEIATPDGRGRMNRFQGGTIYWYPNTGAYATR